jgi:hypothetical protein
VTAGIAAASALIAALSLAACGSGASKSTSTKSAPHTAATASQPPARTTLGVGETYQVTNAGGSFLAVTVTKVIDPLTDSGASLLPSMRAVGVKLSILNHGPQTYDSSATGDVSLVLTAGSGVPTFAPSGSCKTPLRDFDNNIGPGEHRDGCVAFSVPKAAKVTAVRFAPHGKKTEVLYTWSVR